MSGGCYSDALCWQQIKTVSDAPRDFIPIMKTKPTVCLALAVLMSGAACSSSPGSRIAKNREAFDSYPADVRADIEAGRVKVGFTEEQTRLALGAPDRVVKRTTAAEVSDVWVYEERSPGFGLGVGLGIGSGPVGGGVGVGTGTGGSVDERLRVVFESGRVTAVEEVSK